MKSSNPVFSRIEHNNETAYEYGRTATYSGITIKTLIMFAVAVVTALLSVNLLFSNIETWSALLFPAMIIGFVSVIIGTMSMRLAPLFALVYAAAEGVILGSLTALAELLVPGVGQAALIATVVIFGVMLLLYSSKTIRVTSRYKTILFGVLISVFLFAIISSLFLGQLFANNLGLLLLISGIYIVVGAFMLTLDFQRATSIVEMGADKRSEWVVSLGLMVTIVWIYIELLRFLVYFAALFSRE